MSRSLVIRPHAEPTSGVITDLSPQQAGWQLLNFRAQKMSRGQTWTHESGEHELAMVILGGRCKVTSNKGQWNEVGRRPSVFAGLPYALYLPRRTNFTVEALTDEFEFASAWVATDQDHEPRLLTPADCAIEIRGGHNATRQINSILAPGFNCHRLVCVEVYTPSGNWSSYPPHKHDRHQVNADGTLAEADLEEIYFYKFSKPDGFAFQRIYTDDRSIDEAVVAQNNDIVLVPEGYHPVSAAYGFDCYYLNFLAGSAQSLAASYDPAFEWTRFTWDKQDPRVPLVSHKMEERVPT